MNITIIGAGNVGSTLARVWETKGHTIFLGVRTPSDYESLPKQQNGRIEVTTIDNALTKSKVILLAIPGRAVYEFLKENVLKDVIIIDATNNIGYNQGMEYLSREFPRLKFVKAFNTIGYNIMAEPFFGDQTADGYYAGDNSEALEVVQKLITDLDLDPVHVGDISMATHLESLAWLWITQSRSRGRDIAFKLLTR